MAFLDFVKGAIDLVEKWSIMWIKMVNINDIKFFLDFCEHPVLVILGSLILLFVAYCFIYLSSEFLDIFLNNLHNDD